MTSKIERSGPWHLFPAAMNATESDFGEENKIGYDDGEPMSSASTNAHLFVDRFALLPRAVHISLRVASVMRMTVEAEASYIRNMNNAVPRGFCTTDNAIQTDLPKHMRLSTITLS